MAAIPVGAHSGPAANRVGARRTVGQLDGQLANRWAGTAQKRLESVCGFVFGGTAQK